MHVLPCLYQSRYYYYSSWVVVAIDDSNNGHILQNKRTWIAFFLFSYYYPVQSAVAGKLTLSDWSNRLWQDVLTLIISYVWAAAHWYMSVDKNCHCLIIPTLIGYCFKLLQMLKYVIVDLFWLHIIPRNFLLVENNICISCKMW